MRGLSLVVASGGHSSSRCAGLSLSRPLLLRSTGSRRAGSVVVGHRLNCSAACEIFPDQGSNPCPLYWQADSQPLRHQGSPKDLFLTQVILTKGTSGAEGMFSKCLYPFSSQHAHDGPIQPVEAIRIFLNYLATLGRHFSSAQIFFEKNAFSLLTTSSPSFAYAHAYQHPRSADTPPPITPVLNTEAHPGQENASLCAPEAIARPLPLHPRQVFFLGS